MKVFVKTYGCSANVNNGELLKGLINRKYPIASSEADADLVVINSCVVKGPTENKILRKIQDLDSRVVVTGCMADSVAHRIKKVRPDAVLLSSHRITDILSAIDEGVDILDRKEASHEVKLLSPKVSKNHFIEVVQISEGCVNKCSYCATKIAKGELFSYPAAAIIKQIADSSSPEIWLTSQDTGAYGLDIGTNLVELLQKIVDIPRDFRIRIGMINPHHVKRLISKLIPLLKHPKVYQFMHIPVQSGSDDVLRDMRRGYFARDFLKIVGTLRAEIPDINIWTDIICGFPTETDEDFSLTLKLIQKSRPDGVHISRFWPRDGTKAALMKQLSNKVLVGRTAQMMKLCNKLMLESNSLFIGKTLSVFFNERAVQTFCGRTGSYRHFCLSAPISPSSSNHILSSADFDTASDTTSDVTSSISGISSDVLLGTIRTVLITDVSVHTLKGHLVN